MPEVKNPAASAGDPRHRFGPWVGKISWSRALPAPGGASLIAQSVKNLPAMQETWVQFLGQEDPLEKGTASILAWRIPWTV